MKVISSIVGLVLLSAAFILAYLANTNANEMITKKEAIVMKYVDDSTTALEEENISDAIKFAKLAIAADTKNKAGFKALEAAYETKYKPADDEEGEEEENESVNDQENEEEAVDMGC
jgi:hypothetical protein